MSPRSLLGLVVVGGMLAACSRTVLPPPVPPATVGAVEVGDASWYGVPYHGRRTASGEVFDMHELTAAHRTLPIGTRALVTSRATGQVVEVRVNDRGPFVDGRILDLSFAAARVIGAVGPGVIPVRLIVIALPDSPPVPTGGGFSVQVGSFTSRERAEALRLSLPADAGSAVLSEAAVGGERYYRVRVGAYADRAAAGAAARRLAERGYQALVVDR
jgi:rare lipoprotein A